MSAKTKFKAAAKKCKGRKITAFRACMKKALKGKARKGRKARR